MCVEIETALINKHVLKAHRHYTAPAAGSEVN